MKPPGLVFFVSLAAILSISYCASYYEHELEDQLEEQDGFFLGHELGRRDKNTDSNFDSNNDVIGVEEPPDLGPCAGTPSCSGLFQVPVPPSCECECPSESDRDCSPEKVFDDNICECVCEDININCPGKSDFDFDVCNCVCPLHEEDCGPGKKLEPNSCVCIEETPTPPEPTPPKCPVNAAEKCQRDTQYLDPLTCKCACRRYLVKKPYYYPRYNGYRRYPYYGRRFHSENDEGESRSKRSDSAGDDSDDSRPQFPAQQPLYALTCPVGKRVDHYACVCYW